MHNIICHKNVNFNISRHKTMTGKELKELREKAGIASQEKLAEILGVHKNTVYNYENSDFIDPKKAAKIKKGIDEFVTNNEDTNHKITNLNNIKVNDPLEVYKTSSGNIISELPDGTFEIVVPFVPVQAQANYLSEAYDIDYFKSYKEQKFRVAMRGNGNYLAWQIKNDSMDDGSEDGIKDGDIVLAREVSRQYWRSKLHYHSFRFWIIVTTDDVLCKEIISHNVEQGIITAHSLNPDYKNQDIHLNDVRQLFNIIPTLD